MKKVIVKTDLIKRALAKLGAAVNNKTLPALENIYCNVEGGTIQMTTCDTEMMIKYSIIAVSEENCEFYLRYHLFKSIIGLCKEESVEFEPLKASVKIKCGKDVYTLKFNSKLEEFPKLSKAPSEHEVAFDSRYVEMLLAATESVAKQESDSISRVCLNINYTGVDIVGTDGYILYKYNLPTELSVTTTLLLSQRMVKVLEGLEQVVIKWDENKFSFSNSEVLIVINRPEFKYPNYLGIIPDSEPNLKISRTLLTETFKKLNIYQHKTATLQLSNSSIKATLEDKGTGDKVNAEAECDYSGQVPEISLNASDVLRLLHQTTCEELRLSVMAYNRAVVVRGEDPNYLALIIPTFGK